MKRKSLFALVILIMALTAGFGCLNLNHSHGMVTYAASSTSSVWDGTASTSDTDYYKDTNDRYIYTAAGFKAFANEVNGGWTNANSHIYLETDIDLNSIEWTPIEKFNGTFHGNGHYIYNLTISTAHTYVGLFGEFKGRIENLNLKDVQIKATGDYVGAVAGIAGNNITEDVIINKCFVDGQISGDSTNVGGIAGAIRLTSKNSNNMYSCENTIQNVKSSVSLSTAKKNANVGGVVGLFLGNIINNAAFDGEINVEATAIVGGIVGFADRNGNALRMKNVYSVGELKSSTNAIIGGLIGKSSTGFVTNTIDRSYNAGNIVAASAAYKGGILGYINSGDAFILRKVFNAGDIGGNTIVSYLGDGMSSNVNLLYYNNVASTNSNMTIQNVYCNGNPYTMSATIGGESVNVVDGLSTFAKTKGFYSAQNSVSDPSQNWDFENEWVLSKDINGGYPYLKVLEGYEFANGDYNLSTKETEEIDGHNVQKQKLDGQGTEANPYIIRTAGDLAFVSYQVAENGKVGSLYYRSAYYSLRNNLDLSGRTWQPIGKTSTTTYAFAGVFNGNGHTISGLTSSMQASFSAYGLFGFTRDAIIKNLIVKDVNYLAETDKTGAFIGRSVTASRLINCVYIDSGNDYQVVGSGTAYVYKGKLNYDAQYQNNKVNTYFNTINSGYQGYDVEVDSNGGIFYSHTAGGASTDVENVITGEYHVLVDASGSFVTDIKDGFYQTSTNLPQKYSDANSGIAGNFVIKEGYKLAAFKYKNHSNVSYRKSGSVANYFSQGDLTLVAQYDETYVDVVLVYNQYEAENFGATLKTTPSTDNVKKVPYDSILLSEWEDIFAQLPQERDEYALEGVYFDEDFTDKAIDGYDDIGEILNWKFRVTDDTTGHRFYAKWRGISWTAGDERDFSITINLGKYDTSGNDIDYIAKRNFNVTDAVESITLYTCSKYGTSAEIVTNSQTIEHDDIALSNVFTLTNTLNSDAFEKYYRVEIAFVEGYRWADSDSAMQFVEKNYGTYGKLTFDINTFSKEILPVDGNESGENARKQFNAITFRNLYTDYTMQVKIQREKYTEKVNIEHGNSEKIYFAVAPNEKFVNGGTLILNGGVQYSNLICRTNDPGVTQTVHLENTYIGYDFKNGVIITSADALARYEYSPNGNTAVLSFNDKQYKYERIVQGEEQIIVLYMLDNQGRTTDTIVKIYLPLTQTDGNYQGSYTFEYFYGAGFVFLFSTEDGAVTFRSSLDGKIQTDQDVYVDGFEGETIVTNSGGGCAKEAMIFSDMKRITDTDRDAIAQVFQGTRDTIFVASTQRTQLVFDYRVVDSAEFDENTLVLGEEIDGVLTNTISYAEEGDGHSFGFTFVPNVRYTFDGNFTIYNIVQDEADIFIREVLDNGTYTYVALSGTFNQNTMTLTINTSNNMKVSDIVDGDHRTGIYEVIIVPKKVEYNVDVAIGKLENSSVVETDLFVGTEVSKSPTTINYDTEITFFTQAEFNNYVFVGWHDGTSFLQTENAGDPQNGYSYTIIYNDLIRYNPSANTVYAVYQPKEYTIDLYRSYAFDSEVVDSDYQMTYTGELGIEVQMNVGQSSVEFEELSGINGSGFYVKGYKLFLLEGYTRVEKNSRVESEPVWEFADVNTYTEQHLKEDTDAALLKQYFVLPVIARKTASLTFAAGAENVLPSHENISGNMYNGKFGDVIDISGVSNAFLTRTGYTRGNLQSDFISIDGENINLDSAFFAHYTKDQTHEDVTFTYNWIPNTYIITFDENQGMYIGQGYPSLSVEFDHALQTDVPNDDFVRVGYSLDGWSFNGNKVIDANGAALNSEVFQDSKYVYANDITLNAIWKANKYKVAVYTNGANSYYKNGDLIDEITNEKTNVEIYMIDYDSTFATILNDYSGTKIPEREGFVFSGLYFSRELATAATKLTSDYILSTDMAGVNLTNEVVLSLYVGWSFDDSGIYLPLETNGLKEFVYSGEEVNLSAGEYLTDEEAVGLNVSYAGGVLRVSTMENTHTAAVILIDGVETTNIVVKDAGTYLYQLELIIQDDAEFLNLGDIWTNYYSLNVNIEKAPLNTANAIQTEQLHLVNVKKIVSPFFATTDRAAISECQTFINFVNVFKQFDNSITGLSNAEVYEYLMIKYYLSTINDDITYRNWVYSDYLAYKTANAASVTETLEMLTYFDYYIYGENAQKRDVLGYSGVFEVSSDYVSAQIIENEVVVSKYCLVAAFADEISPNSSYTFRVYFSDISAIENYQVSQDAYGYYIQLHDIHILPQIYVVEDIAGNVQSYYNGNIITTDFDWTTNRESYTYSGIEYYRVGNGLYLSATMTTSNIGSAEQDTEYNFFDNTNILYFKNQRAIFVKSEQASIATNYFTFILPEDYIYTILNISTIAEIKFTAKYLSSDGSITITDIDFATKLLNFDSIVYNLGAGDKTLEINGKDLKSPDGTMLGEVRVNNDNEISILITDAVKKLVVTTKEGGSSLGSAANLKYIKLYKWSDSPIDSIDGTMEQSGIYELDTTSNNIDFTSTDPINYYAIYTDLVLVNYNLNFPESYTPQSVSSTVIKLGSATKDDWFRPYESGFVLTDMRVEAFDISYENLFDENDVFIGLTNYSNSHAPITISVRWKVEDVQATQIFEGGTYKVGSFDMLFYNNIVDIENYNDRLFTYSYEWKYNGNAVSTTEMLTLENGGVASASGEYSLVVTATIKDEFIGAVDADGTQSTFSAEFDLNFMANKVTSIVFTEVDEVTYSSFDYLQTWYMTIYYKAYVDGDYSTTEMQDVIYYVPSGVISHTIKKNNVEVLQMKNAGVYSIETQLDSDYYVVDENSEVDTTFTYTILPYVFELENSDISFTKKFNETERPLTLELHTGIEYITIDFARESGEDVGLYKVYLSSLNEDSRENYILTMSGDVVFENSAVVGNNVQVGNFEILQSGVLKLYYQTSALLSENLSVPYDEKGYTATITGDFKLKIYCGPTLYKTIDLILFDVDKGEDLVSGTTYNILKEYSNDIQVKFYSTEILNKVENQSGYLYYLVNGNNILKYYSNVLFENGYQFIVTKKAVNVSTFVVDKTYNGKDVENFNLEGEKIDNIEEFDGVYVKATYADTHVASDIRVDFELVATGEQEISNYELSALSTTATISKLNATYSAETTKASYVYGEISEENFASMLTNVSVTDANNVDVKDLLVAGYYTLTYTLPANATANASGYIYAGSYAVTADSTFVDFNMLFDLPTITIIRKEINHSISQAMFRKIVTNVDVGPYVENYSVNETGDTLTLEYYVRGKSAGDPFDVGYYHLDLAQSTFANNSILIIIPQENNGLQVLPSTNVVYLRIDTPSILTQTYNGQAFVLSVDSAQSKLIVTNGENSVSSDISFWEGATRKYITDFTEEVIYYSDNQTSFTSAGQYKLALRTNSNTYPNIMFESEYVFEVAQAQINVSAISFTKEYDGDSGMTIDLASDVFIVVKFADSAVGTNKAATIYLNGDASANYVLSTTNVVGEITKAAAILSLTRANYTYGQFTQTDKLNYVVEKGEEVVNASEYSVTLTITDAAYSSSWNYLNAGQYQLGLSYTSTNYQISLAQGTSLNIDAYELQVTFNESGKILARYGTIETQTNVFTMTYRTPLFEDITLNVAREAGTDIGYYKALTATSANPNYFIDSDGVRDNTDGVYRILKSTEKIYLLLTDQATITDNEEEQISFEFDGFAYNTISVGVDENGGYKLVLSDGTNNRGFHLSTYTYESGVYTKVNVDVQNLTAEINLSSAEIRNVATYSYSISNALALNYDVALTRYGKLYNYIEVTKKDVHFNESVLTKVFDNEDAVFTYEDANELTTGVVDGDAIGLEVEFRDGANLAKFVGTGYGITARLTGEVEDLANYNLVLKTQENVDVSANITKAELVISLTDATYVYGSTIYLQPNYSTEVDLTEYDMTKIDITLSLVDPQYSTSGNLKVGEYHVDLAYNLTDFNAKLVYNGNVLAVYNRNMKVTITPRELAYQKAGTTLENVFKKIYDGTTNCDITGLTLVGVLESVSHNEDDVAILSASYEDSGLGQTIKVTLTLAGDDAENYSVPVWQYGVIEPIIVNIAFDYNAGSAPVKSNVENRNMTHISRLAFPFVSTANISANSYDAATAYTDNFPTSLSGFVGHTFATWTLRFASVVEGSAQYNKFVALANTYTLTYAYENGVFAFNVSNKPGTAALLNYFIRDDEENYSGMYYEQNSDITITFVASWITSVYDVVIYIDDETGTPKQLGVVVINETELTENDIVSYEYNENVQIVATANAHTSYYGFYDDLGRSYDESGIAGINVSRSGSNYILEIEHITSSYVVHVRFREQRIMMAVDMSGAGDASVGMEGFTHSGNFYSKTEKYLDMENYTFADLQITRLGYAVESITCEGHEILAADFETAKLSDYVDGSNDATLLITPHFVAVGVIVTLDYGYDDITRLISVSYNATYGSSAQWVESPEREGYTFVGWYDENDLLVTGETQMTKTEAHTLSAQWNIATFEFVFDMTNATISVDGTNVDAIVQEITFGETFTFEVVANQGYVLPSVANWAEELSVEIHNGVAEVSITMPGRDVEISMDADAGINNMTISGQRIDDIVVYELGASPREVEAIDGKYGVYTGNRVRVILTAAFGYQFSNNVVVSDDHIVVEKTRENDTITLVISNFTSDFEVAVETEESTFDVEVEFSDNAKIDHIIVDSRRYESLDNLSFSIMRGESLEIFVMYNQGSVYDQYETEQDYQIVVSVVDVAGEQYTQIVISNVEEGGHVLISSKLEKYTLTLRTISYNENQEEVENSENRAVIFQKNNPYTADYGTMVVLRHSRAAENYNFAGWSRDGINIFNSDVLYEHTITQTETIYAIYSATKFIFTFGTYDLYSIYAEYQDPSRTQVIYNEISGLGEGFYEDESLTRNITRAEVFYGANKTIYFKVPTGYRYSGFGYKVGENFQFLGGDDTSDSSVAISISTMDFDTDNLAVKIYAVLRALSSKIDIKTQINIDGYVEENTAAGSAKLVGATGVDVNRYGYVDGTRVHYTSESFVSGALVDGKEFSIIAYTGETAYIQVLVEKEGYKIDSVLVGEEELTLIDAEKNIYAISNIMGGENLEVVISFKPMLNKIDIKFKTDVVVEAGAFTFETTDTRKVFASGNGYSKIEISAYTDSSFTLIAYISMGYYIDSQDIQIIDENGLVDMDSVRYLALIPTTDGFSAKVSFDVSNYLGSNEIYLKVEPRKYTAKIYDDDNILLVEIKNVEYDKTINLLEDNIDNIQIYDERIFFDNGRLNVKITRQNFNFEGYFSYQNGAGIRYINSDGVASSAWKETGYYYDTGLSRYKLTDNANINEAGEMEISLYLYMSYNKTRISFEMVPAYVSNVTAKDMIVGVDYTNSWFYEASPYYIEIAYNTPIKIIAPEIDGYKFYKIIFSQRNINGEWLTDVVSYSGSIPWETNELDNIVECKIKMIYFALVTVVPYGGEGEFVLTQHGDDSQAQQLIEQNYVDTTKVFKLRCIPADGYEFVRWNNITSSRFSSDIEWDGIFISQKTTFVMNMQGKSVTMKFSKMGADESEVPYDITYGQIINISATSGTGRVTTTILGSYSGGEFNRTKHAVDVRVGDTITLTMAIDHGYGVVWNRDDIKYGSYFADRYTFTMKITPEMAEEQSISVFPMFKNEIISVYINKDFEESQKGLNAVDKDNVDYAGDVLYQNTRTKSFTIQRTGSILLSVSANARYKISQITLTNYDHEFDVIEYYKGGRLQITQEFISTNEISGIVAINIFYVRMLWQDKEIEGQLSGLGTKKDPYIISSAEELTLMMKLVNSGAQNEDGTYYFEASYLVTKDIELGKYFWTPIGTTEYAFNGRFNFGGHLITIIYLPFEYSQTSHNGLFGVVGADAVIIENNTNVLWWYLAGALGVGLVASAASVVFYARKRKKIRQKMSVK